MIQIPNCGTILAPANLHLPLYQEILKQKSNCTNIQVLSLSTWMSSFYSGQSKSELEILYKYKEALENLSYQNAFYSSIEDYDFLEACLSFIKLAKTYQINEFPSSTQKEEDLHEILEYLLPIQIQEDQTKVVKENLPALKDVYILKKEYSLIDQYWIKALLEHGAQWLGDSQMESKNYYSCTNTRKQMEVIANTIIENHYLAENCFVAVNDIKEQNALEQVFSAHNIPYTLLVQSHPSCILDEWISYLEWIYKKDLNSFLKLVQTFYPKENEIYQYFSLFPNSFQNQKPFLKDLEYESNEIIQEFQFEFYKRLEEKTFEWIQEHSFLWNDLDFVEIAIFIQNQHTDITYEDLTCFNECMNTIQNCNEYIHNPMDLSLLIQQLKHNSSMQPPKNLQGVLIGSRKDICALRSIVFMTGIHASNFPNLKLQSGIFDESYVAKTSLPNLEYRISSQQNQIFDCLSLAKTLYVLYPQNDYQGKNNEPSLEMNNWMETKATFKAVVDSFTWEEMNMDLDEESAKSLFFKDNHFKGSISRLESYARCPFSHALKYGLYLQEKTDIKDIRVWGSILHHILEIIAKDKGKEYTNVSSDEISKYIHAEFQFVRKVFYTKEKYFLSQMEEIQNKLILIFEQLKSFENQWHMSISKQEHKFSYSFPFKEYTIDLYGYIDRIDESSTSFCIFDYKSSDKDISFKDFESGLSLQLATYTLAYEKESQLIPVGCFYIALQAQPISFDYGKINYRKKITEAIPNEENEIREKFSTNRKLKGWSFSDLSIYSDDSKNYFTNKRDTPNKEKLAMDWEEIMNHLLEDISSGKGEPLHQKDACKYCAYKSICRNAAQEVEKISYLETKEENEYGRTIFKSSTTSH